MSWRRWHMTGVAEPETAPTSPAEDAGARRGYQRGRTCWYDGSTVRM